MKASNFQGVKYRFKYNDMKKKCLTHDEDEEEEEYDMDDAKNDFTREYNEIAKILQEHAENAPNDLKEEDQRISKQARYR